LLQLRGKNGGYREEGMIRRLRNLLETIGLAIVLLACLYVGVVGVLFLMGAIDLLE
jgi:hypothetical protein